MKIQNGSLLLFRAFGVDVFVNWTWLVGLALLVQVAHRDNAQEAVRHSYGFFAALYLCLFATVLLHEFGHALACKSVGGLADRIVLWPLGGIAFVQPPPHWITVY